MAGHSSEYPYHEWHGENIPIGCGTCYAIYQRHNRDGACKCLVCQTTALTVIHEPQWEKKVTTLNICDRCETPATSNAMGDFTKRLSLKHDVESFELCPGCVKDFVAFMNAQDATLDRPKAYKEPYVEKMVDEDRTLRETLREILAPKDATDAPPEDNEDW